MKNLIIMRHAKSDWNVPSKSDFDRPLNERGLKCAPLMGTELIKRNKKLDLIISSPANRAKSTATLFGEAYGFEGVIIYQDQFYFGSIDEILEIIKKTDNKNDCIMIVGHNPTWESLVYRLLKTSVAIQMPTAAMASIMFNIETWENLTPKSGEIEFFLIPKDLMC
jgi:phosphohistidine phosphatase